MVCLIYLTAAISIIGVAFAAPSNVLIGPAPQDASSVDAATGVDLPDFELGGHQATRRQDYTQNYRTGGSVNFQPNSNGYSVTFSGAADFVVGKGWNKGSNR
jgi:endo-1,4-beta-xylanase